MGVVTKPKWRLTDAQLREAEEGLRRLLGAKGFTRKWMDEHLPEVMSAARTDFAARLAVESVNDTVSLLVVIAYRRALKLVRSERSRPQMSSIDTMFHLADEKTLTPEEEALDRDRQMRLVKAMGHLPEREQKLLALVYFDEVPLCEAGRRLGWAKASATRHHQAALERLKALIGDRNLLGGEIAIPAYVVVGHHSPLRAAGLWVGGAAESLREAALLGSGRLGPLADTGNAAAMGGGGRAASGACALAVGACLAAATGVVGPGLGALGGAGQHRQAPARHPVEVGQPLGDRAEGNAGSARSTGSAAPSSAEGSKRALAPATVQAGVGATSPTARARGATAVPKASTKQTINEFGVEQGESGPESTASSGGESTAAARVAPSSGSGSSSVSSRSSSGSQSRSGGSSGGAGAGSEFGM